MPTPEEKSGFSKRLAHALRHSAEPVQGPTELALRFNLRHAGNAISAQTAHKWLTGRTIPTPDKLATLAAWLKVDLHWLHYGPGPAGPAPNQAAQQAAPYSARDSMRLASKPSPEALNLALKIQGLAPHRRYLLEELVEQFLQDGR